MSRTLFADPPMPAVAPSRDPATVAATDACPHCRRALSPVHEFDVGGETLKFWSCPDHGDIVPVRVALAVTHAPVPQPARNAPWRIPC